MTNKPRGLLLFLVLVFFLAAPQLALAQTDTTATDTTATVLTGTETIVTETTTTETTATDTTATEETTTYFEDDEDADDDRDDALACGICATFGLGIPILGLLISLGIAWWIYKDATRRGNPQAVLWAILGFFFNILGLIIYLIARPTGPPAGGTPGTTGTPAPPPPPQV